MQRETAYVWITGAIVLLVCLYAFAANTRPVQSAVSTDYSYYQAAFTRLVAETQGAEKAAAVPQGIQQLWMEPLNRPDRCVSCHLGVAWQGLEDAEEPFRTHPPEPLLNHPIEKFGCTLCHGGQGYAVTLPEAHGWVKHWEDPLLGSAVAEAYRVKDPYAFTQIKCNICHRYDKSTAGADYINRGKELVQLKGCRSCHTINGRGGRIGPDLTRIGDKNPEQYDYSRLTTQNTLFAWHVGHLQSPKSYSPGTVMPEFGFTSEQAQSLTMLLLSWRDVELPAELLPGSQRKDVPTVEEAEQERLMREGEGRFFVEKSCFICHDVSSLGIESATKIGPDLAQAVADAPRRFGRTLDDFLMSPTGTMSVVLSTQIILTDDEKREAIRLLKIAYEKYQHQQAASGAAAQAGTPAAPAATNEPQSK